MKYSTYIFDFDGTLADTSKCITTSANEALEAFNYSQVDEERIRRGLGLRLDQLFRDLGVLPEHLPQVISLYKKDTLNTPLPLLNCFRKLKKLWKL